MRVFKNLNIPKNYKNSALAIGNFDGVHKGHKKVFIETKKFANKNKIKFGVLTFNPLPVMFFNKKIKNFRLSSDSEKLKIFKKNKVNFTINVNFNKKFSKIKPDDFIKQIIHKKIKPKLLAVSNNFRFGQKRKGNTALLKKFSSKYNYNLLNTSPLKYMGKIISSTKIRKLLKTGNIALANKLLSRTWFIEGKVEKGKGLGRKLGYRTCNILINNYIIPRIGIYAVKVSIDNKNKKYSGVAYLGSRPTFNGKKVFLEVYLFNIDKNLYGKKLRVYFLKFLRKDQKFSNSEQLIKQMNKDVISAKKGLKAKLVL